MNPLDALRQNPAIVFFQCGTDLVLNAGLRPASINMVGVALLDWPVVVGGPATGRRDTKTAGTIAFQRHDSLRTCLAHQSGTLCEFEQGRTVYNRVGEPMHPIGKCITIGEQASTRRYREGGRATTEKSAKQRASMPPPPALPT